MFVPAIDEVPTAFEVCASDEAYSVLIPLAVSDDGVRHVAAQVLLLQGQHEGVSIHELKFGIAVAGDEADEAFVTYDRDMARGYIPDDVRPLVMPSVCAAIVALVDEVLPAIIYRVTYATRPPEKALPKHNMITDTLAELGFSVHQSGTDAFGRQFWAMSR